MTCYSHGLHGIVSQLDHCQCTVLLIVYPPLAVSAAFWRLSKWPGSYIRPRGVRVELPVLRACCLCHLPGGRNFDFVGRNSESGRVTGSYIRNLRVSGCCCKMNTSNPFVPLYNGYIFLSERDPDSSSDREIQTASEEPPEAMEIDCSFDWFSRSLDDCSRPGEPHAAGPFDNRVDFELGDPGANFEGNNKCEYATSGEVGEPHWPQLFQYLLSHFEHVRLLSTVFVLVDNRDLTAPRTEQESVARWPTVEAWWASRLALHGPARELCDVLFVPIDQTAGLEHVHPTWAGTFVLAALVFLFPGVHIVLLDSDCVPITLFEVADLWKEISLLQNGLTRAAACCPPESHSAGSEESAAKASRLSRDRWHHQVIGQGVLLVTEHNAEINAGFIVAFASCHKTAVQEDRWRRISDACRSPQNLELIQDEASRLANLYWDYVSDFLDTQTSE